MGIQINGNTDIISASDGSLTVSGAELTGTNNINISGIVTATGGLRVGTGGTVITTTAGGFVGIGTTNPSQKLDVYDGNVSLYAVTSGQSIRVRTNNGTIGELAQISGDGTLRLYTNESTPILRTQISSYGNTYINPNGGFVGIGTNINIGDVLEVFSPHYGGLTLKTTTSANRPTLSFLNTGASGLAYIQSVNREIAIGRANADYGGHTETARFDSSGNLGIGSAIPENKLDVNGTIKSFSGANKATFKDNQLRSDASGTFFFDHGTASQSFTFRTSTSSSLDTTGPSITSAGNISFPSGKGIDFSATANSSGTMSSELLADYEEGSFTPIIYGWTGTYAIQYGQYTKIGRQVFIHCEVLTNANTGSFTELFPGVGNLPFAISSDSVRHLGNWGFLGNQTIPANSVGAGQWDRYNSTALFPNDFKTNAAIGNWNSQSNSVSLGYRSFISYFVA